MFSPGFAACLRKNCLQDKKTGDTVERKNRKKSGNKKVGKGKS